MHLINERVFHCTFGTGLIVDQTDHVVTVRFDEQDELKEFLYPLAFASFLKLDNPVLQTEISSALKKAQQMDAERQRRKQEFIRCMKEVQEKRAAAKRKNNMAAFSKSKI